MKNITPFVLVFCALTVDAGNGNDAQSMFAKNFLAVWATSTDNAIEVAEAMPEALYDYKPNDSSMTFREQLIHLSFVSRFLANAYVIDNRIPYEAPDASVWSKEQVIEYMKTAFGEASEIIGGMTETQANETITILGGKEVPRYIGLMFIQDHTVNHRAKANLYIRMNDIKPPRYRFL